MAATAPVVSTRAREGRRLRAALSTLAPVLAPLPPARPVTLAALPLAQTLPPPRAERPSRRAPRPGTRGLRAASFAPARASLPERWRLRAASLAAGRRGLRERWAMVVRSSSEMFSGSGAARRYARPERPLAVGGTRGACALTAALAAGAPPEGPPSLAWVALRPPERGVEHQPRLGAGVARVEQHEPERAAPSLHDPDEVVPGLARVARLEADRPAVAQAEEGVCAVEVEPPAPDRKADRDLAAARDARYPRLPKGEPRERAEVGRTRAIGVLE